MASRKVKDAVEVFVCITAMLGICALICLFVVFIGVPILNHLVGVVVRGI